ncbi:HDOD domain-containing protein [Thermomicrobium sp. 4228-Ro]|uniref:EAL and HDOD domain-containing protein n=1 Tax=Thermomicrobium sp. 4228-Ro TaxID=2993937 RepID=UPI002248DBBE|nr:HDOD domain-containing protein [Thermomicrobium sp. 4228-Ro]MCX2728056.1 HDOD domain-containing protein [Thermomicrobium sp. 4228-Ro]
MHEIAIARQPIFDRHLETVAYELRYGQLGQARVDAEEEAGRFLATLLDTGLETLAGSRLAVVTLPASFVVEKLPQLVSTLPTEQLVLVLDPAVAQHPAGCEAVNRLVARGCQLLLDLDEVQPVPACVADVDIVRLRLPRLGHAPRRSGVLDRWLAERMADLASYRSGGVRVLVSDIRDFPAFARSRDIGADLFQGDFLFRPLLVRGRRQPVSTAALTVLARLHDPTVDFDEVERLIAQDVSLAYKLLKLVNSVWFARRTRVESLRQALLVLGLRNVATWVTVLVLAGIERKPVELVRTGLVRARMCELLAGALGVWPRESAFLVGLLSVLDAALDVPLADALAALPLAHEVEAALLERSGELGRVLDVVLAYEAGEWVSIPNLSLPPALLIDAYIDALAFAADALQALDLAR